MLDPIDDIVYAVGDAIITPNLGHGELLVALLVAIAFAASAVKTWLVREKGGERRREPRF